MQQITASPPVPPRRFEVIQTVMDGLLLPLRRPVLFAPFFLLMVVAAVVVLSMAASVLLNPSRAGEYMIQHIVNVITAVVVIIVASIFATEATVELTARAELGRDMDLGAAFSHVLRRFPATIGATLLVSAAVVVGLILLVIPGLIVMYRLALAPTAVLLSGRGVREALGISWQITGGHFWQFSGLFLLVIVGIMLLSVVLALVPVVGGLAAGWLSFAWAAIAVTLAYLRLGGPAELQ